MNLAMAAGFDAVGGLQDHFTKAAKLTGLGLLFQHTVVTTVPSAPAMSSVEWTVNNGVAADGS